ncbi:MAG: hypothetical protein ACREM3_26525 [Candidatus Rokuibacteriota bacterium]
MRESELVARRVVLWSFVAAGLGVAFAYLGVGFRPADVAAIFSGKLAFLGLVLAAGTLQYGVWRQSVKWADVDLRAFVGAMVRHNRVALSNYVFINLAVLLSCVLDALAMLTPVDVPGWRHVSTALLAVAAVPFAEILVRHVGALGLEFDAVRRELAAALRRGRLDDRAPTR